MLRLKCFATYFKIYSSDISRRLLVINDSNICRKCLDQCCTSLNVMVTPPSNDALMTNPSNSLESFHEKYMPLNLRNEIICNDYEFFPDYCNTLEQKLLHSITHNDLKILNILQNNKSECSFESYNLVSNDMLSSLKSKNNEIILFNDQLTPMTTSHFLLKSEICNLNGDEKSHDGDKEIDKKQPKDKKPSKEQLDLVERLLIENFTKILSEKHDFSIYTKDIEFVNNWFPDKSYSTVGTMQYGLELAKLKLYVHVRLASLKMTLLKVTNHIEDCSVRMRWRIVGIPHSKNLMKFFSDENKDSDENDDITEWLDGFSTFYIDDDGLIKKHVMDRIIPEDGKVVRPKSSMIEKLGLKMPLPIPS